MEYKKALVQALSCLSGALVILSPVSVTAQSLEAQVGQWQSLADLPFFPVHNHLLPNGKVLFWSGDGVAIGESRLWDPATGALSTVGQLDYNIFCAGHSFLADGRLLAAGGQNGPTSAAYGAGVSYARVYDPISNSWTNAPDMNAARWYPTVTTLANGEALVLSGTMNTNYGLNTLPQVYQPGTNSWRNLTSAQLGLDLYPMMFVAPNGKVINVGPTTTTRYLDTQGTGAWTYLNDRPLGYRDYGSAVMYDGKILVLGGGGDANGSDLPKNTAELLDLNKATSNWQAMPSMSYRRRHLNATLLPDGTVLVTGGTSGNGFNNETTPVYQAELWTPQTDPQTGAATGNWSALASATVPRLYHSAALLLPDGRVITIGGNGKLTPEVFLPPYWFKGARPPLSDAPSNIAYGQSFSVSSADAANIAKITLIRIASVTHAFDENQRLNTLTFTKGTGALNITAPADANSAPPGHYLLFLVNGNGVPSIGSIVQLGGAAPPPPPPTQPPPATKFTLAVTKGGSDSSKATVTSSPAGIDCGSTCNASFDSGVPVTLTARTVGNTRFAGWSGACTGNSATCTVTMDSNKAVTATFNRR